MQTTTADALFQAVQFQRRGQRLQLLPFLLHSGQKLPRPIMRWRRIYAPVWCVDYQNGVASRDPTLFSPRIRTERGVLRRLAGLADGIPRHCWRQRYPTQLKHSRPRREQDHRRDRNHCNQKDFHDEVGGPRRVIPLAGGNSYL